MAACRLLQAACGPAGLQGGPAGRRQRAPRRRLNVQAAATDPVSWAQLAVGAAGAAGAGAVAIAVLYGGLAERLKALQSNVSDLKMSVNTQQIELVGMLVDEQPTELVAAVEQQGN